MNGLKNVNWIFLLAAVPASAIFFNLMLVSLLMTMLSEFRPEAGLFFALIAWAAIVASAFFFVLNWLRSYTQQIFQGGNHGSELANG